MNKLIFYIAVMVTLTSCGGPTKADFNNLNAEVEQLKNRCDSFQESIHNKNLTSQDIQDRQYEIDNINNILHADERSLSSCITRLKSAEAFVRQLPSSEAPDDETIYSIYRQINEINAELKRCASDIESEGTEKPAE